MPNWPATLPQYPLESGFSKTPATQKIATQMDTGPAKQRRRTTKLFKTYNLTIACTPAQEAIFEDFFHSTCKGGTISFTWVDPLTRAAQDFVFLDPPPQTTVRPGSAGGEIHIRFVMETR